MKLIAFFIIFKGLPLEQIEQIHLEGDSPTLFCTFFLTFIFLSLHIKLLDEIDQTLGKYNPLNSLK